MKTVQRPAQQPRVPQRKDRMLLGTESGQLVLLDISEETVTAGSTPAIATFSGLGKVVDMDFYVAKNPYCYFGF